jgi:hypothetical protein
MGKKMVHKTKSKTGYVQVISFGKKSGSKTIKAGKRYGVQKAVLGSGKTTLKYEAHSPAVLEIHEGGQGLADLAELPVVKAESAPAEQEAELAGRLVNYIADGSADVRALCEIYGLKREELGRLTGFSLRALAEWANGQLPSQPARRRLKEVKRLLDALAEIVRRGQIPEWLHRPNPAFAPLTPLQVIELGEMDRLWAMVHDLGSGQPD